MFVKTKIYIGWTFPCFYQGNGMGYLQRTVFCPHKCLTEWYKTYYLGSFSEPRHKCLKLSAKNCWTDWNHCFFEHCSIGTDKGMGIYSKHFRTNSFKLREECSDTKLMRKTKEFYTLQIKKSILHPDKPKKLDDASRGLPTSPVVVIE